MSSGGQAFSPLGGEHGDGALVERHKRLASKPAPLEGDGAIHGAQIEPSIESVLELPEMAMRVRA